MSNTTLPYIMKPRVFNRGVKGIILVFCAFSILIFSTGDISVGIASMVFGTILVFSLLLYFYRAISIDSDAFSYRSVWVNKTIRYEDIQGMAFGTNGYRYFLMVRCEKPVIISDLQLYKRDDVRFLVTSIVNNNHSLNAEGLDNRLSEIKWIG